jgi:hypothetical protein
LLEIWTALPDQDQAFRLTIGKWRQYNTAYHAENGGVGSYSEGQSKYCGYRLARILSECPNAETHVLK